MTNLSANSSGHGPDMDHIEMMDEAVPMCYGSLRPSLAVDSGKRRQCRDGLNNGQEKGDDMR